MLTTLYVWSRKFHRYLVLIMTTLMLIMAGTGLAMKYPDLFSFLDLAAVRLVHNRLSIVFAIALVVMVLTGLMMYFGPALIKRSQKQPPVPNRQPQ